MPKGFTFVELLLSVAIFSIAAAGVYASLHAGLSGYARIDESARAAQRVRILFSRLEKDVSGAVAARSDDSGFKGDSRNAQWLAVREKYASGNRYQAFCLIRYGIVEDKVMRTCACGINAVTEQQADAAEAAASVPDVSLAYARTGPDPSAPFIWQDQWPSADAVLQKKQVRELPVALKVKAGGFEKILPLAMAREDDA